MRVIVSALALSLVLALCSAANADVLGPITTTTPIPSTLTNWTGSLAFQQFDPSVGTLTSVELYVSGSMSTTLTLTNLSPSSSSGHANTHLQISVQDAGGNLTVPQIDISGPSFTYDLDAGHSITSGLLTKTGHSDPEIYTLAAILAEFTGTGTVLLNAGTFTETAQYNTGGNTDASQVTNASLTGTVTYSYIPIPEPVTMSLLGLGGLAMLARRRR